MIKQIVLASLLISNFLYAGQMEENVLNFEKQRLSNNKRMQVKEMKIIHKEKIASKGWYAYIIDIELGLHNRIARIKDIVFTNGSMIATELNDIKTGVSLKKEMSPKLNDVFHNKEHLMAGSHNAKDKIVVFSDPMCSACKIKVLQLIKYVNERKNKIGLYYYHFTNIQVQSASSIVSKAMIVAQKEGSVDIVSKIYSTNLDKLFDKNETETKIVLDAFNNTFNTNITTLQLEEKETKEELMRDIIMADAVMITSTPSIFINGIKDKSKEKYKTLGMK